MTTDDALYGFRLRVFSLATELGSVRAACRAMGIHHGNADEIAAAKASDTEGFVAARDGLVETQTELEGATAAAGVPKCADVHKK